MRRGIVTGLIASIAATLTAIGMLTTLVPLHAARIGFDAATIGWIAAAYYLGFLAGPWLTPPLVARAGSAGAFAISASVALAAVLALPFLTHPGWWALLRCVAGGGFSVLYILVESGLNAEAANANRGRLLSAYLIASKAALIGGQLLIGVIGIAGPLPFALAAAMVALAALVRRATPGSAARGPVARLRPMAMARAAPLALFGCFLYGIAEGAFFACGALFASARGLTVGEVATFMSAFLLGGALAQWPIGALSDRIDRRLALLVGSGVAVVSGLLLGLVAAPPLGLLLAGGALAGASLLPLYALWVALANDATRPEERIEVSSALMLAYAAGAVLGPPAASSLMALDAGALPLFESGVHALLIIVLAVALRRRTAPRTPRGTAAAGQAGPPDLGPGPPPLGAER